MTMLQGKKVGISIGLIVLMALGLWAQSGPRFALVIGNNEYQGLTSLQNPVNDATDMGASLTRLGFQVQVLKNASQAEMDREVVALGNRLTTNPEAVGLLFFAGHGVQSNGVNYLIPSRASIPSEEYLSERAVSAQSLLNVLNRAGNGLNIVVLDACRDNPFGWSRSGSRGLSVVGQQPPGSVIVYATSAGSVAQDGSGRNGVFTAQLLQHLETPGIDVSEIFRRTGAGVRASTNGRQIPAVYNQFFGLAQLAVAQPTARPSTQPAAASAGAFTNSIGVQFMPIPAGTFSMGSASTEPNRDSDETQRQVSLSAFRMAATEVTQAQYQRIMGANPSGFKGDTLPVEQVSWYDAIVFCNKLSMVEGLSPAYSINGNTDPARWGAVPTSSDATWNAVQWNRNANGYRLPTEAEWEYAGRAGTTSPFATGNTITTAQANYNDNYLYNNNAKGEYRKRTTPVASLWSNAWGLADMHGNVWEWCWDWYGSYPNGSENNPMGLASGTSRVLRGGSWFFYGRYLRSANRSRGAPQGRNSIGNYGSDRGFRLVLPAVRG